MVTVPRLHRYIFKELMASWLAVSLILYIILVSHRLVYLLNLAAQGKFSTQVVLPLIGLVSISFLPVILSFTFFLAALLVVGRLARDNELAVMFACGFGPSRLFGTLLLPALPVIIGILLITLWISPLAEQKASSIRSVAEQSGPLATMEPGRFATIDGGRLTVYLGEISNDGLQAKNLFVTYQDEDKEVIISAKEAHFIKERASAPSYIEFVDGLRSQGVVGQSDWQSVKFDRHGLKLKDAATPVSTQEPSMLLPLELYGQSRADYAAELQWRFSIPIMLFILLWLALPLGNAPPRQGRFVRLLIGMLIYLVYLNGVFLLKKQIGDGRLPPFPGMWPLHILAAFVVWRVNYLQFAQRKFRRSSSKAKTMERS